MKRKVELGYLKSNLIGTFYRGNTKAQRGIVIIAYLISNFTRPSLTVCHRNTLTLASFVAILRKLRYKIARLTIHPPFGGHVLLFDQKGRQ